jgi:hypothetical protein
MKTNVPENLDRTLSLAHKSSLVTSNTNKMNSTTEADNPRGDPAAQDRRPWLETPLDASRSSIRILNLRKGSGDMSIVCSLKVASLDDDPYYESLSYVWEIPRILDQ